MLPFYTGTPPTQPSPYYVFRLSVPEPMDRFHKFEQEFIENLEKDKVRFLVWQDMTYHQRFSDLRHFIEQKYRIDHRVGSLAVHVRK